MTVGEIVSTFSYGVPYMLVGAKTGKKIGSTWTNKKEFLEKYFEKWCGGLFPTFRSDKNTILHTTDSVYPVIAIWVSGE